MNKKDPAEELAESVANEWLPRDSDKREPLIDLIMDKLQAGGWRND